MTEKKTNFMENLNHGHIPIKVGSSRNFGLVFSGVFAVIALWPLLGQSPIRVWAALISVGFASLGLFKPTWLNKPNQLWFKFGILLGSIIAPIVIGLVYVTTVIPTGLYLKLARKDPMNRAFLPESESYWINREDEIRPFKYQF